MLLNLNFEIKDRTGNYLDTLGNVKTAAQFLALALDKVTSDDPIKMRRIANELYDHGQIELDDSDLLNLKEEIKKIQFINYIVAPIIEEINKLLAKKDS